MAKKTNKKGAMKGCGIKNGCKSKSGGLTAKGRRRINSRTGSNLKPPQPGGGARKKSYCARSAGQMKKFPKAAKDPNSRLRKARRKWKC
jgi:hypothetical protein|tara:strand:- start:4003 stop:4269 length:267 start_codon:yes stop_codon:yes gene_type:complete